VQVNRREIYFRNLFQLRIFFFVSCIFSAAMAWTTRKLWNSALLCTRSVPCAVRFVLFSVLTQFHLQAAFIFHFQSSPSEVLRSTLFLKPLEVVSKVRQTQHYWPRQPIVVTGA
jgi:hypothetical protein